MRFLRLFPVLVAFSAIGCGATQPSPVRVQPPAESSAADTAKGVLEGVAESGELGSGGEELKMALEEMKSTDSAKAEELLQDYQKLESAGGGDAAKTQAKAMLDKL